MGSNDGYIYCDCRFCQCARVDDLTEENRATRSAYEQAVNEANRERNRADDAEAQLASVCFARGCERPTYRRGLTFCLDHYTPQAAKEEHGEAECEVAAAEMKLSEAEEWLDDMRALMSEKGLSDD